MFGLFSNLFSQLFDNPQDRHNSSDRSSRFRSISERAYIIKEIRSQGIGRIRYRATDWNACTRDGEALPAGMEVIPIELQGNTWFVVPVNQSALLTVP